MGRADEKRTHLAGPGRAGKYQSVQTSIRIDQDIIVTEPSRVEVTCLTRLFMYKSKRQPVRAETINELS